MTLVFPREMPNRGIRTSYMELQRFDLASPENGGNVGSVTAGFPRWMGRWSLVDGADGVAIAWRSWVSSLRGSQRLFIGRDMDRPWPIYYRAGLPSGWSGALTGWSQSITADGQAILSVEGLHDVMGVGAGDGIDFRWTGGDGQERRTLVRCVQDVPSSGGAASFPIEPPVPPITPANAVAHMDRPGCLMRLDTSNTQIAETDMTRASQGASVIAGMQAVLP